MARRRSYRRRRSRQQQSRKGLGWLVYALIVGTILIIPAGIILLNQVGSSTSTGVVSLDKSKGAAEAPVVVVEYGDFQ